MTAAMPGKGGVAAPAPDRRPGARRRGSTTAPGDAPPDVAAGARPDATDPVRARPARAPAPAGSRGPTLYSAGHALPLTILRHQRPRARRGSSRSSTRPTSSRPSSPPCPTRRSASGSTSIRAEIAEDAAPEEPSEDELNHHGPERRSDLAKARRKRDNERLQAVLDDADPRGVRRRPRGHEADAWACATTTSS